jgi:FAD:protein FMN transferase
MSIKHALNGPCMGSRWSAVFYADTVDVAAVQIALAAAVEQVEAQMSTWRPTSNLMRLNAAPVGDWVAVPPALCTVLVAGLQIGQASSGAFDMGVGDLVARWGFGAQAGVTGGVMPRARATTTALQVDVPAGQARKTTALALDLSGIAKGFGVDQLAEVLDAFGIGAWLVGIDGEMRARGAKPDGQPWAVALEQPAPGARAVRGVIALADQAVATSGDYRHFTRHHGKRVSHTMDARQGGPVDNGVASVTVIAPTCTEADAWATALFVLGPTDGAVFARTHGLSALFVLHDGEGLADVAVGPVFDA